MVKVKYLPFMFMLLLGSVSCCSNVFFTLEDIESYIQERPDSALVVLQSIDRNTLKSRKSEAKFSLLYAMALDKNYIDTTDVGIILPAVKYYSHYGSADEKLKALYYEGVINANNKDDNAAAISFSRAETYAPMASDDKQIGQLNMAQSLLYRRAHNISKEKKYIENALFHLSKLEDKSFYNKTQVLLAEVLHDKKQWEEADSLYKCCIEIMRCDSVKMPIILSNYANLKILSPQKDPEGAIKLLNEKLKTYHSNWSLKDFGYFAYASALIGDMTTTREIYSQILSPSTKPDVAYLKYLCDMEIGDFASAINNLNDVYSSQDQLVSLLLSNSLEDSIQNYYQQEIILKEQKWRINVLLATLIVLLLIITLAIGGICLKRKHNNELKRVEDLLTIAEDANRLLKQSNDFLSSEEQRLNSLRKGYLSEYKDKYATIRQLCDAYLCSQNRVNQRDIIYRQVEELLPFVKEDDKLYQKFENQINNELNNIIIHLKEDLAPIDSRDVKLICFSIVGLYPQMIATILGWSLSNVYTRKSRLKERIRNLDSPYKDDYLRLI